MNFVSMPENGASWAGELPVAFEIESGIPSNVEFQIVEQRSQKVIGRVRLYGVVEGRFDIAPYVRQEIMARPMVAYTTLLRVSPASISVYVTDGKVVSPTIMLFRSDVSMLTNKVLSHSVQRQSIAAGEQIHLTAISAGVIEVEICYITPTSTTTSPKPHTINSFGVPVDIVIVPIGITPDVEQVVVKVICDHLPHLVTTYRVVQRDNTARRLIWLNPSGGFESYTFPVSRVVRKYSEVAGGLVGRDMQAGYADGYCEVEVASGFEPTEELERISEIVLSPAVYEIVDGVIAVVELVEREVKYGTHGKLHQVKCLLRDKVKGGVR